MQAELSPVCLSLAPARADTDEPIPFMGVDTENEWITVSTGSGPEAGTDTTHTLLKENLTYGVLDLCR